MPFSSNRDKKPKMSWNKVIANLTVSGWNPRSLTFERFKYCESLNIDIQCMFELWRTAEQFADGTVHWTYGKPDLDKEGNPRFPNDRAAGVGILLSKLAQSKCIAHGSPCERICWVRLKGPVINLFIVAVYMPHRNRTEPSQSDILKYLYRVFEGVPKGDCIICASDLNENLPPNVEGITGKWAFGEASKNANEMLKMLQTFELVAVNTLFQPKKGCSNATYIANSLLPDLPSIELATKFIGRPVRKKYRKKWIDGEIVDVKLKKLDRNPEKNGAAKAKTAPKNGLLDWEVKFKDGFTATYGNKAIKKMIRKDSGKQVTKQIDYILVSRRWVSSVTSAKTLWGPSIHRNIYGKSDHGMVHCTWK